MARPLRISYPNAFYHVTCRGNDRRAIFRDDHEEKGEEKGEGQILTACCPNHKFLVQSEELIVIMLAVVR